MNEAEGPHLLSVDSVLARARPATSTNTKDQTVTDKPSVLFVCVHNAGRSQMAAGFLTHLAGDRIEVRSAGSEPADRVNPIAVEAMNEVGSDISAENPKILTVDAVQACDVCVTTSCGDTCPYFRGKRYLDWTLPDPAGQGIEAVRLIRDEIDKRVRALIDELAPAGAA
jgi:arsenate reductase